MKQRLYDFPRRGYIKEWEQSNCRDHDRLIEALKTGDRDAAVRVWRDVHWSFEIQEKYIRRFYSPETREVRTAETQHLPSSARTVKRPRTLQRQSSGGEDASA
jgi:DNA-binding GntR family transcriptional regulator